MAMVHEQRHHTDCRTPTRCSEHDSRRRVAGHEGPLGLDAEPPDILPDSGKMGTTGSGYVHISADDSAGEILQLETRPRGRGPGCIQPGLDHTPREGLCQPPLEPGGPSAEQSSATTGHSSPDSPSVDKPAMVPSPSGNANRLSSPPPPEEQHDSLDAPRVRARPDATTSRVAYLRRRYEDKEISEDSTELLLASWRQKSSQSYDSLFRKWVDWFNGRISDPVSGPISEVVNFLAHLLKEGYQYRSLNAYRSAISSVHERVDGYEVGKHPLISTVMKGAFHLRPPQPRYDTTWDVTRVLDYIRSQGSPDSLPLRGLTWKLAMLLALTSPSRSADLVKLDLRS